MTAQMKAQNVRVVAGDVLKASRREDDDLLFGSSSAVALLFGCSVAPKLQASIKR